MARVTTEKSVKLVGNRFDLVIMATERAYAILCGAKPLVENDNRPEIIALREIEEGKIDINDLKEQIIEKYSPKAAQAKLSLEDQIKSFAKRSKDIDNDKIFEQFNLKVED